MLGHSEENNSRVLLVGAGNVATSLAAALKNAEAAPVAVWSRSEESACRLSATVGCGGFCDFSQLPDADIIIISVTDNALPTVAKSVAQRFPRAIILHTAGSVPMAVLRDAGARHYGVFYPMQTFSRSRVVDFSTVTLFVEGCSDAVTDSVERLARKLTDKVCRATSEQRRYLHLAAVFACNFANASYAMAAELMQRNGLPFEALLPLIDETAAKVHTMPPHEAQTGPAARGDIAVIERQRALLSGDFLKIYDIFSNYIGKNINR